MPQRIDIKPSAALAVALCAAHLAAAVVIWLIALPAAPACALVAAIAAGLAWSLPRRAALRHPECIVAVEITQAGRITVLTCRGGRHAAELMSTSYVSPRLTILNLRLEAGRRARHVVLVPDNVDAQDFRRLRTWLRWAPKPDRPSDDARQAFP